ncbi:hypothetical protein ACJIZ3_022572 [Penstemon smallii]|uniref:Late embryogenesis abundant protein n=1 Tax=Penstemon smallii TaxID=265156 RepID=A0ABD3TLM0_9LAMI
MAAANLQKAILGKRFSFSQICSRDSLIIPSLSLCRRNVHGSVYDKNPEEHSRSTVVPDHVIPPQPEQYWAPHPKTGVFGPATDQNPASDSGLLADDSVLEQKTFFRPQEDLDKPVQP